MKKLIGIMALLLMSPSIFAEDMHAKPAKNNLIESDAAVETAPEKKMPEMGMKEQAGFSRGSVARSAFTREIADREPTEDLQSLTNENGEVKFFTELRDMSGQTATHRWEYNGKVVAEVKFDVKGPRWRVWSSKKFVPQWTGDWKVLVVNGAGEVISEKELSYDVATTTPATNSNTEAPAPAAENTDSM